MTNMSHQPRSLEDLDGSDFAARTSWLWRTADGLLLQEHSWRPLCQPVGSVMIVHGLGDHGARFDSLAQALVSAGYAVHALDQRGHGASQGPRANTVDFADHVGDLHAAVESMRSQWPGGPAFVLGHSWGALVTLSYLIAHGEGVDGMILCGPAMRPHAASRVLLSSLRILSSVAPNIGTRRLPLHKTTRNIQALADFQADPLVYRGRVRARMAYQVLKAIDEAQDQLAGIATPALLLHGTSDPIAPIANSRFVYDRIGSTDRALVLYDGLHHQLFNEPERDTVFDDVTRWLRDRTASERAGSEPASPASASIAPVSAAPTSPSNHGTGGRPGVRERIRGVIAVLSRIRMAIRAWG